MRLRYGCTEQEEKLTGSIKLITDKRYNRITNECKRAGVPFIWVESASLKMASEKPELSTFREIVLLGRFGSLTNLGNSPILIPENNVSEDVETISRVARESDKVLNALIDLTREYHDVQSIQELGKMIEMQAKFSKKWKVFLYEQICKEKE